MIRPALALLLFTASAWAQAPSVAEVRRGRARSSRHLAGERERIPES